MTTRLWTVKRRKYNPYGFDYDVEVWDEADVRRLVYADKLQMVKYKYGSGAQLTFEQFVSDWVAESNGLIEESKRPV